MDNQRSLLNLPYYFQTKGMEELRQLLVCTSLEVQTTKLGAQEEIKRREEQLAYINKLVNQAIQDRDEAIYKCYKLLQQQQKIASQVNLTQHAMHYDLSHYTLSIDDGESIVTDSRASPESVFRRMSGEKPLPEKGKLLEAVMKAGPPLLQNLILAGDLPHWRHPPPPSYEITPVTLTEMYKGNDCRVVSRKRSCVNGDNDYIVQVKGLST